MRGLNTIETRLAAAMADPDFPPVAYAGLKREELHRTGSVVLHEYYFDALGGNGNPGGSIYEALDGWFGSYAAWEAEFRRTAMSLAGESGWCILSYNRHTASLHNYWASDHTQAPVNGAPLIASICKSTAFTWTTAQLLRGMSMHLWPTSIGKSWRSGIRQRRHSHGCVIG